MHRLLLHLRVRPRLSLAAGLGLVVGLCTTPWTASITAGLIGWNAGVWTYLGLMAWLMAHADQAHLQRTAVRQAPGAAVVLGLVVAAAIASLGALGAELAWLRQASAGPHNNSPAAVPHLLLTAGTVVGAWLLLPVVFSLSYASRYHQSKPGTGLVFPDDLPDFQPHYTDFLYFALTIAVAAQTSDVVINRGDMRQLVMWQAVLSFGFNTAILALAINIAAGLL